MIRHAKILEIPKILDIARACTLKMIENGIYQWNEHYPSREAFETDIHRGELYVLEINASIAGMLTLTRIKDEEYNTVDWLSQDEHSIYVHRLGVHPGHQHKGYAQKLMDFGEDYARRNGFASVRLDTFSQNLRNQKFYEQRGYQKLSHIHFPKQSQHPFYCYELVF